MLKLVWFIGRPASDIRGAESLYQIGHVRRGMRQENLRSFRIARAVSPQPGPLRRLTGESIPPVFRFSEGYWDSFQEIEECYRSPNGLAALADGMLNATKRLPDSPLPVLLAEEERLPAPGTLPFDIFAGRFQDEHPRKLLVFLGLANPESSGFDEEYAEVAAAYPTAGDFGPHVLSRTREYRLELGRARQWPPEGAAHYHRIVEIYFRSPEASEAFLETDYFSKIIGVAEAHSAALMPILVEPQHVFFTTTGNQPIEAGWQELYD